MNVITNIVLSMFNYRILLPRVRHFGTNHVGDWNVSTGISNSEVSKLCSGQVSVTEDLR